MNAADNKPHPLPAISATFFGMLLKPAGCAPLTNEMQDRTAQRSPRYSVIAVVLRGREPTANVTNDRCLVLPNSLDLLALDIAAAARVWLSVRYDRRCRSSDARRRSTADLGCEAESTKIRS